MKSKAAGTPCFSLPPSMLLLSIPSLVHSVPVCRPYLYALYLHIFRSSSFYMTIYDSMMSVFFISLHFSSYIFISSFLCLLSRCSALDPLVSCASGYVSRNLPRMAFSNCHPALVRCAHDAQSSVMKINALKKVE